MGMGAFFCWTGKGGSVTEQVYQRDSYVREFDARVTGVEGQAVALDRTAFFPGGGGQPQRDIRTSGSRVPASYPREAQFQRARVGPEIRAPHPEQ